MTLSTTIDLTDELLDRWLERLKDPETKRNTGALRSTADPDAMCCLGHLADIVDPDGWRRRREDGGYAWESDSLDPYKLVRNGDRVNANLLWNINDNVFHGRFPIAEIEALR